MTQEVSAIFLTLKLALVTSVFLLLLGVPLALWLATTRSKLRPIIESLIALPIVLPPTVIGFYLLWLFGPEGWGGQMTQSLGLGLLPFTFSGLVVGSIIYSLPFVVQPLQNTFESIGRRPFEVAASLRSSELNTFFKVLVPLSRNGLLTAFLLGFLHTIGEFGVVLMIGGNIPNQTRVLSVLIFDHVEALEYGKANQLALLLIGFSFMGLFILFQLRRKSGVSAWIK